MNTRHLGRRAILKPRLPNVPTIAGGASVVAAGGVKID